MSNVKRAFVKYTKDGKLIPGSLIVTTKGGYPKDGLYREVITDLCCSNTGNLVALLKGCFPSTRLYFKIYCEGGAHGSSGIDVSIPGTFTSIADVVNTLNTYYSFIGSFSDAGSGQITLVPAGDYSSCFNSGFYIATSCEEIAKQL